MTDWIHWSAGAATNRERDEIEEEVALLVKACSRRIAQLQKSVEAEQNSPTSISSAQAIAHMHGIVSP